MLKKLKIKNFKSIDEEIEISFEPTAKKLDRHYLTNDKLLKLILIYGPNASGKTNIIKAIEFIRNFIFNPPINKETKINIIPFKFKNKIEKNSKFILEFIEDHTFFIYEIELNDKKVLKEILRYKNLNLKKSRLKIVFERNEKNIIWGNKIKIKKSEKEVIKLNTLPNAPILNGYLRVNIKIEEIEKTIKFFKKIFSPVFSNTDLREFISKKLENKEITKNEIIKILKNAGFMINDFNIDKKETYKNFNKFLNHIEKYDSIKNFKDKEIEIWFSYFKKYQLEYKDESNGTQRFFQLAIILILLAKYSYIISIDEIESSFHPDLLKFFILTFLNNSKNSQLILTTHTRELLLEKEIIRKDTICFCDKKKNGSTDLFSLSDFGNKIKNNSLIYNYYKYGKIGAIPNIKNLLDINE